MALPRESVHLSEKSKILVVMLGAIGDVVRGFPLVSRIKKKFPSCHITWAVETSALSIVKSCSHVDRIIEFKRAGGISAFQNFIAELRSYDYDVSLDLQRHFKSGIISYLSKAPFRIGFNLKNSRELNWLFNNYQIDEVSHFEDKIEQLHKFADFFKLPKTDHPYDFGLNVSDQQKKNLIQKLKSIDPSYDFLQPNKVLFLVGSVWETKRWMPEYYAELAERIFYEKGLTSVIVGAPHEMQIADTIVKTSKVPVINLVGKTSLDDFRVLCSIVRIAVGSDSGPLHIASAMGVRVVSLWGPTSPTRSKPYNNLDYAIQSPIGCQGCYMRKCEVLNKLCLREIKPELVHQMFNRALQ